MASLRTNRIAINAKQETVNGTRVEPLASDADVAIFGSVGQPTIDSENEVLGKSLNGTMLSAPVAGGKRKITFPDFSIQVRRGATADTKAKFWKFAEACGYKIVDATVHSLVCDGKPTCTTLSADLINYSCNGSGVAYKGRGMVGNMTIGAKGPNSQIIATVTGLTGAYVGQADITGESLDIVGADTQAVETMANYVCTIGATAYEVASWEFNPNSKAGYDIANNSEGIATGAIVDQDPKLTLTVMKKLSSDTQIADTLATTSKTITITGGAGAGTDFTFTGCQALSPTLEDVDGSVGLTLEYTVQKFEMVQA